MIKREKDFFHLASMFTNEEGKMFFFLFINYDHYAMMKRKKVFFSISYYDYYAMIKREKSFFSFTNYDHYAMIQREKSFFHLATIFTNEEMKMFCFI